MHRSARIGLGSCLAPALPLPATPTSVQGPIGSPKYLDYLKGINDSGPLLLSIINDILDLSKIEAGKQELHRQASAAEDVFRACLRLVKDRADQAGVRVSLSVPLGIRALNVDVRAVLEPFGPACFDGGDGKQSPPPSLSR